MGGGISLGVGSSIGDTYMSRSRVAAILSVCRFSRSGRGGGKGRAAGGLRRASFVVVQLAAGLDGKWRTNRGASSSSIVVHCGA